MLCRLEIDTLSNDSRNVFFRPSLCLMETFNDLATFLTSANEYSPSKRTTKWSATRTGWSNGAKCWNGPHRTMTATLVCGASERMLSVDEPSVCEYTSVVETPAVCTDAIVASVRHAHEQMELDAHDELRR